jgi:sulfur-oxidizing protein SoxY
MKSNQCTRRHTLKTIALLATVRAWSAVFAAEVRPELPAAVRDILGNAKPATAGICLAIPELAETGQSVPIRVDVDSTMSGADRVTRLHIIAENNPRPNVADITFGALMPRATLSTRVRLAGTQDVYAIAWMSDGTVRMARANVVVTQSACIDGT